MDLRNIASFRNYGQNVFKMLKNPVQISRFLTPAKIRRGLSEILAVSYRVRPRP